MSKLTAKQDLFCKEYLVDLNATQAAVRAGYSERTAKSQGARLLTNVDVAERIQQLMTERSKRVEIDADWVLNGIKDLTDSLVASEDPSKAYKGFELAGKHLKLFTDKVELGGKDGEPIAITTIERKIV